MKSLVIQKKDLVHNIERIKEHANKNEKDDFGNSVKIIAVVKGNGYGLGLVEFTKFLIDNGISYFAVATIEEALELRNAGIKQDILMLSTISIEEDIEKLVNNNIIIVDSIKISCFIPAFLNSNASSIVATAKYEIPLSIKNLVSSTNPNP